MNILLSAIGSMSSEAIIKSLKEVEEVKIIGCDIYPQSWIYPSKLVNTFYQVPRADSLSYVHKILEICVREKVDYFFPLTDLEIDVLIKFIDLFESKGVTICISPKDVIQICRDKKKLFEYFSFDGDISLLPTYDYQAFCNARIDGFFVAKPRCGRSSEGLYVLDDFHKIGILIDKPQMYIFQPFVKGTVITVDIVKDLSGNSFFVSREELIRTKNGAGITIKLFNDEKLASIVRKLIGRLNFLGCFNAEFIFDGTHYFLMDINPRFSAGIAFSNTTGYDFVQNHLNVFMGKNIERGIDYSERILCKRYVEYF